MSDGSKDSAVTGHRCVDMGVITVSALAVHRCVDVLYIVNTYVWDYLVSSIVGP